MKTTQLDAKISAPGFLGAFPYDELPERAQGNFSLVVNTEVGTMPGDHWVALIKKEGELYFIDSYGRDVKSSTFPTGFTATILKYIGNSKWRFNSRWLQQLSANTCGEYCVYFIQELGKGTLNNALSIFSDNLAENDKIVTNYVKNM